MFEMNSSPKKWIELRINSEQKLHLCAKRLYKKPYALFLLPNENMIFMLFISKFKVCGAHLCVFVLGVKLDGGEVHCVDDEPETRIGALRRLMFYFAE